METIFNNNNIINYIKHGYEIIIYAKQNNWDYHTIKAFKEQISYDNIIFYDIETKDKIKQNLINSWIIELLRNNNDNNLVNNLAIEFRHNFKSETFFFCINKTSINDNNILKITIFYEC